MSKHFVERAGAEADVAARDVPWWPRSRCPSSSGGVGGRVDIGHVHRRSARRADWWAGAGVLRLDPPRADSNHLAVGLSGEGAGRELLGILVRSLPNRDAAPRVRVPVGAREGGIPRRRHERHCERRTGFLDRVHVTYPAVFDPDAQVASAYGIYGLPVTVFISANGRMLGRHIGQLDATTLREALRSAFASTGS